MNESIKRQEPRLLSKTRLLLFVNLSDSDYGVSGEVQRIRWSWSM